MSRQTGMIMKVGAISLACAAAALMPAVASGVPGPATLYVAGTGGFDGPGTDSGTCTVESSPCATLAYALTQAASGDTIEVSGTLGETAAANVDHNVTIRDNPDGTGATIQGASADSTGLLIIGDNTVSISDITFQDGHSSSGGGAIASNSRGELTINGSTFTNDSAKGDGGAIDVNDNGSFGGGLTVADSTFTGNSATDGGAIDSDDNRSLDGTLNIATSSFTDNTASGNGGAIDNNDNQSSDSGLAVTDSTFVGNSTHLDGGAIDTNDRESNGGNATVTYSTLTENLAVDDGGAIDSNDHGSNEGGTTVIDSSLTGNTAGQGAGIDSNDNGGPGGSITVAGDVINGSCHFIASGGGAAWSDGGYNAASDDSCLTGSSTTAPDSDAHDYAGAAVADLGTLADNGGPTQTIELLAGNPAIGLIPASTSVEINGTNTQLCPAIDQRGVGNAGTTGCDGGAVQWASQTVSFASATTTTATVGQTAATLTATSSSGLPVALSVDPATTHGACTISAATVTFVHAGSCVVDANQAGDTNFQAAAPVQQTITVSAASTSTSLSASNGTLTATVTAAAPGGGTPSGTVEYLNGAQIIGTATLAGGAATLAYTPPANTTQAITAFFEGSADYLNSTSAGTNVSGPTVVTTSSTQTATVTPQTVVNPTITASLSSSRPQTANGWWTDPVTVTFACNANGATLTAACPSPIVLSQSGAGQQLTETIKTSSGGTDTVALTGIDIDLTRPRVRIAGPHSHRRYLLGPPRARCRASEPVSGIRTCKLTSHATQDNSGYLIHYTARATSIAGTTATSRLRVQVQTVDLLGATVISANSYRVAPGTSYTLEVLSNTQPTYLYAAVSPRTPSPARAYFQDAGKLDRSTLWTLRLTITAAFSRYTPWTIGFRTGGTTHLITLQTQRKAMT